MDRIVTSHHEAIHTRPLARPTSAVRRFRGRLERLRFVWRRAAFAAGIGLVAAGMTVAWMTGPASPADTAADPAAVDSDDPTLPATPQRPAIDEPAVADDQRILALDRSAIALPVSIGSVVEVIGLRPTLDDVRAEVIAARARVVGVTEDAILVAVEADAAHTAAEIAAVGRVTILGRDRPPG